MLNNSQIIEIIGYVASVLVAISLMMSAIVKLRIINLIGSLIFTLYGIIISAYPVAFVNGLIAIVNVYYLFEIFTTKEYFDTLKVKADSEYLQYFLKFHEKEIKKFVPNFSFRVDEKTEIIFVLRNSVPAGLVCAKYEGTDTLFVDLDYVIPGYRDFKIGKFVYQKFFKEKNIKNILTLPGNKTHERYLRKMGFVKISVNSKVLYSLILS